MIQSEPAITRMTINMPKASASTLLVLSGPGGDVQEEHQMDAHLGDGENGESQRHAGRPKQRGVGRPERRSR